MKTQRLAFALTFATLLITTTGGCSHAALDQSIDAKLENIPSIDEATVLRADVRQDIETSALNADQKTRLLELNDRVGNELDNLRARSRKLRALLAEEITQPTYDSSEVSRIKTRLKEVEEQRLMAVFSSVDEANQIIGRAGQDSRELINHFLANQEGRHPQGHF